MTTAHAHAAAQTENCALALAAERNRATADPEYLAQNPPAARKAYLLPSSASSISDALIHNMHM
jgi:hypothetical protein